MDKTDIDLKDKKDKEKKKPSLLLFLEYMGGVMIGLCIIGILISSGITYYRYSSNNNLQDVNIRIMLRMDTTGVLAKESAQQVDSLKEELVRHEQLLENRYKHVLEQKENLNDLLTIGGMFLTTILALFGFFGYKSITTLEEKVKEDALSAAEKTAVDTLKTKFETFEQSTRDELGKQLRIDLEETTRKDLAVFKTLSRKSLEDKLEEMIKEVNQSLMEETSSRNYELKSDLEDLTQKLSDLKEMVIKLQKGNNDSLRGRRTL